MVGMPWQPAPRTARGRQWESALSLKLVLRLAFLRLTRRPFVAGLAPGAGRPARVLVARVPTTRRRGVVVNKRAERGCLEIVELPTARRPHIRGDRNHDDAECHGHQNVEDAHGTRDPKDGARQASSTTVRELSGISTATTSGLMRPAIASPAPARL